MSLPKPPFPCVSSSQNLLPGYTRANEFFRVSADILPPNFPYAPEQDTLGVRIPYRYYTGPGPPPASIGFPGDIYHDFLSGPSREISSSIGYARTTSGWTPWAGVENPVCYPFLPVYVLRPAKTQLMSHEWDHINNAGGYNASKRLEKAATKQEAEMQNLRAAADARGLVLLQRTEIEARNNHGGGSGGSAVAVSAKPPPWPHIGELLPTHMSSKRDAFIAQVTEWTRLEAELVNSNAELACDSGEDEHPANDVRAAHATLVQSNTALVANIANAKLDFSRAWEKLGKGREGKGKIKANLDSISEVLDRRVAEVSNMRNQLELKQRHIEEPEAKHNAAVAAKDEEIAVITLSRNTTYSKLSERDAQIVTQARDIQGLSARLEQAARGVNSRHAARSELGMTYDTFFRIPHLLEKARRAHQSLVHFKDTQIERLEQDIEALRKANKVGLGTGSALGTVVAVQGIEQDTGAVRTSNRPGAQVGVMSQPARARDPPPPPPWTPYSVLSSFKIQLPRTEANAAASTLVTVPALTANHRPNGTTQELQPLSLPPPITLGAQLSKYGGVPSTLSTIPSLTEEAYPTRVLSTAPIFAPKKAVNQLPMPTSPNSSQHYVTPQPKPDNASARNKNLSNSAPSSASPAIPVSAAVSMPVTTADKNHTPLGTSALALISTPISTQAPKADQTPAPSRLNNLQKLAIALAHQKQAKHAQPEPPSTPTAPGAQSLGNLALNFGASQLALLSASTPNKHPSVAPVTHCRPGTNTFNATARTLNGQTLFASLPSLTSAIRASLAPLRQAAGGSAPSPTLTFTFTSATSPVSVPAQSPQGGLLNDQCSSTPPPSLVSALAASFAPSHEFMGSRAASTESTSTSATSLVVASENIQNEERTPWPLGQTRKDRQKLRSKLRRRQKRQEAKALATQQAILDLAIKNEMSGDTGTMLKRKRSANASGDERQTKGKGKKARAVEVEFILVSDSEDGDEAANKSGDGAAVCTNVDGEGDAMAKAKDSGPPPPSFLEHPTTQDGQHRNHVETSYPDSHTEPDKPANSNMEVDFNLQPAVPPPQEPALGDIPISTSTASVIKPEPSDLPLPASPPLLRPLLSRQHLRLVFKKQEDHVLCMACWLATSTESIIPLSPSAAVDHLVAAHPEAVPALLAKSPAELKEAWANRKEGKEGEARNGPQGMKVGVKGL
ncbi:hypothetical protein FIBSPDRAFT_969026 [Athelia psychrophila]|uniref:Uncharacterized protein n=1 Tax=Athelia psychrophila TaxID=1759441 RepID=A0A167TYL0_9AGAM|nr:hypothetical protein FIBSPDRAFT_969026 [Fibularhizoctonia sp. CBS 109695]